MARPPFSRRGPSPNLTLAVFVVLSLVGSGTVAYAWSQGEGQGCGGSLGNSGGGGCPATNLIWTNPATVSKPSSVLCTLGGLGSSTLTVAVERVVPGQSCVLDVALENVGDVALSISELPVSISQPSDCFAYTDNVDSAMPIAPEHAFSFVGTVSLTGAAASQGNTCESVQANIEVTITGAEAPTRSVTFSESGLPSGMMWTVTLNGVTKSLTTNGCVDSLMWTGLASGTYAYSIAGNSGWHQTTLPYKGSVVVDGASVIEPTLVYQKVTYPVTFSESGLPSGKSWSVALDGMIKSSTTSTITFDEPNGTYSYTVGPVAGCESNSNSGSVTVNGAAASVAVKFTNT
jgi:hypothetical protein